MNLAHAHCRLTLRSIFGRLNSEFRARQSKNFITVGILSLVAAGASATPQPPVITELDGEPVQSWSRIHDFTGLPMTADGWTDLEAMINSDGYADARIVYVSNDGNDSTGAIYNQSSAELGGRPLNPTSSVNAYATLNGAWSQIRNGYPDVMLLKRGDSWNTSLNAEKSGRNREERLIIGAYGPESVARPVTVRISQQWRQNYIAYQVIASIDMNVASGTRIWHGYADDLLIEDVRYRSTSSSNAYVNFAAAAGRNAIRRSSSRWVMWAGFTWGSPGTGYLLEQNTIYDTVGGADHNIYFGSDSPNGVFLENQSIASGGASFRNRSGGVFRANLGMGSQINESVNFGGFDLHQNITAEYNLSLHTDHSFSIGPMEDVTFQENIATGNTSGPIRYFFRNDYQEGSTSYPSGHRGTNVLRNNISYTVSDIAGGGGLILNSSNIAALESGATITIDGNHFLKTNAEWELAVVAVDPRVTYTNNRYYSAGSTNTWFNGRTYSQMIPATGTAVTPAGYPDPNRNIVTYMQSIGAPLASNWRQAMAWYAEGVSSNPSLHGAINNRRGAWDERFTAPSVINYIRAGFGQDAY